MSKLRLPLPSKPEKGFTILELMVATMVFAVVLLLVTAGILQIARVYYKGVTEANTQNTARSIIDTIAQAIQFSGGDVTPTAASPTANVDYAFCIGSRQFSYRLGWQVDNSFTTSTHQIWHGLVEQSSADCNPQALSNQTVNGRDLISKGMRLSNLSVQNISDNLYEIKVRVVYGDSDLLYSPSAPTDGAGDTKADAVCRPERAGTQFCAVSELSTIVVKRVE
jgi:prepilin-type N-terminal cleavage/methylation domain-containing protein